MEYMTYKCNKSVAILLAAYNAEKYLSAERQYVTRIVKRNL